MGRVKHIHMVGIGGAGMCGIAEVLHNEGYKITGSDLSENKVVSHLREVGITVFIGHNAQNILGADVVVVSTAVAMDNPERVEAKAQGIPVIPRAAMLAELMRYRLGIAIAGTHGKTTTTSLVSTILAEGGLDPSYVIGGKLNSSGVNAQLGKSPYLVVEADESDASFLFLKPMMAVVTNIDSDHMGTYHNSFDQLKAAFLEFLHHLPFYGLAVLCHDDATLQSMLPQIERPVRTYGFSAEAHYQISEWTQDGLLSHFRLQRPAPHAALDIQWSWPGRHNALNAAAAIAIATEVGVSDQAICQALAQFQGVGRRFQILGERDFAQGRAVIIDDYGHHPTEIAATIDAFRKAWPTRRLIHVFQPHRYTRTADLFQDFVKVLQGSDDLLLCEIYSAGESPIAGISSQALLESLPAFPERAKLTTPEQLETHLQALVRDGDAILMQGAGSISQMAQKLLESPIRATV
ncbi:MAG: UDP-N-acetylmuramate--L-alanine ligase [Legionellaceae bacterium]|nr:UDP-N-acetylmuramate--L-alanine ligase [Legionellaceae bacterium]